MSQEKNLFRLEKEAIKAALGENWQQAIEINQKILTITHKPAPVLNRLGLAFFRQGKSALARQHFNQVLKIDPSNTIAQKNLERLKTVKASQVKAQVSLKSTPLSRFIEEPGKTKLVKLVRLGSSENLVQLVSGQEVFLVPKKRMISILDHQNVYLGSIPEDLSQRLLFLIKEGNKYQAFIKAVNNQTVQLFIKETERSQRLHNQPSFTNNSSAPIVFLPLEKAT